MKTIISKLKKCLCLTLSIFLLTSNMQVFAQEAKELDFVKENLDLITKELDLIKDTYEFDQNINNLRNILEKEIKLSIEDPIEYLREVSFEAKEGTFYPKSIKNFMSEYKVTREKYYALSCSTKDIIEKGVLSELSYKYNGNLRLLNKSEKEMLDISVAFPPVRHAYDVLNAAEPANKILANTYCIVPHGRFRVTWINNEDIPKLIQSVKYFENKIDEMKAGLTKIYKARGELLRHTFTPADILEYAYKNGILPKEKAGIKLTLEAMDADVSVNSLVKSIRKYLTEFGTKVKSEKYSASLTKKLKGMTLAERAKYVDELTELKLGSKTFISDFEKLDSSAKKYVGKAITKGMWELPLIGAIITAAIITEITADNNFNPAYTASIKDISEMKNKIENGEATLQEQWLFYTDERNESLIQKDAVHTLHFVKLAQGAMEAEEILLEAEKENKAQENKAIENSILKNYQKQANKTDFGVGTI